MSFFGELFNKNKEVRQVNVPQNKVEQFWSWFKDNAAQLYVYLIHKDNIEEKVLLPLGEAIKPVNEEVYFVVGVDKENKVELVFTADGVIKNIPVVEEIVRQAPKVDNWTFTALKSASQMDEMGVNMGDYNFTLDNIQFYVNEHVYYPDLIDICLVYKNYDEDKHSLIQNGCFIFLDNYLGELTFASQIDEVSISGGVADKELISLAKLKDYLIWREKEFVEKYQGIRRDTESDAYVALEGVLENEKPLLAVVNSTLMEWDAKPSHPWILRVEIYYEVVNESGMPTAAAQAKMDEFEEEIMTGLIDEDGYLNVGHQTADGLREIFFACKDFRAPVFVLEKLTPNYMQQIEKIDYAIYKDKYWRSLDFFVPPSGF